MGRDLRSGEAVERKGVVTERVYVLVDPRVTDPVLRIRYVGWTRKTLAHRFERHMRTARRLKKTHRDAWITALVRAGFGPGIELYSEVPGGLGQQAEIAAIRLMRLLGADLTNLTVGGDGVIGYDHTPETRQKMREQHLGRPLAPEHRAALAEHWRRFWSDPAARERHREAKRGHLVTAEGRANMSKAQRGHSVSAAQRANIARTLTGRRTPPETRHKQSESRHRYFARRSSGQPELF